MPVYIALTIFDMPKVHLKPTRFPRFLLSQVLSLYISLFEKHYESLEILAHLEIKKMLLDRLVNLLSRGYVIPVVKYIKQCWEQTDTDVSLIR